MLYLVSRFMFPFFCSDFSLDATLVKTDEIRDLNQLFSLNWKISSKIINN